MKNIIVLLLTLSSLSMPTYAGTSTYSEIELAHKHFRWDLYQVQKALDKKNVKFSDAEFIKLSTELKDADAIMNKRQGDRLQYYKVRDEQVERIMKVKAEVDARQ